MGGPPCRRIVSGGDGRPWSAAKSTPDATRTAMAERMGLVVGGLGGRGGVRLLFRRLLFGRAGGLEHLLQLSADIHFRILHEVALAGIIALNHPVAIDEDQMRDVEKLVPQNRD